MIVLYLLSFREKYPREGSVGWVAQWENACSYGSNSKGVGWVFGNYPTRLDFGLEIRFVYFEIGLNPNYKKKTVLNLKNYELRKV